MPRPRAVAPPALRRSFLLPSETYGCFDIRLVRSWWRETTSDRNTPRLWVGDFHPRALWSPASERQPPSVSIRRVALRRERAPPRQRSQAAEGRHGDFEPALNGDRRRCLPGHDLPHPIGNGVRPLLVRIEVGSPGQPTSRHSIPTCKWTRPGISIPGTPRAGSPANWGHARRGHAYLSVTFNVAPGARSKKSTRCHSPSVFRARMKSFALVSTSGRRPRTGRPHSAIA